MKNIFLVDGSWFLFRARYAVNEIINQEWQNVNVVFGFSLMMMKLFLEHPDYFVIAWDSPIKTKRHEEYSEYKANRKKMDDAFKSQIPLVKELVDELGIPNITAPWYEADDIISTLVWKYKNIEGLYLHVYTSDKDLKQFLADNIFIKDSLKGQTTSLQDFEKEYGFEPQHIVDYLALIGDSADNIKGVNGIGPKKALNLVQTYWSIENIYEHLDLLPNELKEKLVADKDSAYFSKHLIELLEVPELKETSIESLKFSIDFNKREHLLFEKWQFRSIEKVFKELKKLYTMPQQVGLF